MLEPGAFEDPIGSRVGDGGVGGDFYGLRLSKTGEAFQKGTTEHGDGCDPNLFSWSPQSQWTEGYLQ